MRFVKKRENWYMCTVLHAEKDEPYDHFRYVLAGVAPRVFRGGLTLPNKKLEYSLQGSINAEHLRENSFFSPSNEELICSKEKLIFSEERLQHPGSPLLPPLIAGNSIS